MFLPPTYSCSQREVPRGSQGEGQDTAGRASTAPVPLYLDAGASLAALSPASRLLPSCGCPSVVLQMHPSRPTASCPRSLCPDHGDLLSCQI